MSTVSLQEFQDQISDLLLRHRSLLDVMSKNGQSSASLNRAVAKAITDCGCIELHASKQAFEPESDLASTKEVLGTHVHGHLCENCKEIISTELGRNMFYLSALCNLLDINMDEVVRDESKKCSTLGLFNMS
ncbi:DUF1573 domain-containing protein [Paenibacillus glacialis]|uniref:DUF1573 domain-containing protein n=1 Tax=Paenibacillus glacialis TaxID=494026 RepID=A0A168EG26_9BACL|nr:DUF1573 domain-containing protein [Paenibacillus glacialis]OAB35176.1 hypothetical protein PGLA_22550 [Paenibacillus glacialis]